MAYGADPTVEYPRGVPWASHNDKQKMTEGNNLSRFMARIFRLACDGGIHAWVENPDQSWLWKLREWFRLAQRPDVGHFRTDFCRFGTPWRKRTRILTNGPLQGHSLFCECAKTTPAAPRIHVRRSPLDVSCANLPLWVCRPSCPSWGSSL